jgi:Cellulose biosynthesis protein BcsS
LFSLKRLGPLTAKAFIGASAIEHDVRPLDPENPVQGVAYGPKAVVEPWLNMGSAAWSSLDVNWTSAHQTYAGRARAGYRLFDDVSVGAEARIDGNELDKDARGGLFVRYAWTGGEVSLAGGVSGRFLEDARDMTDPYATLTWLVQY